MSFNLDNISYDYAREFGDSHSAIWMHFDNHSEDTFEKIEEKIKRVIEKVDAQDF